MQLEIARLRADLRGARDMAAKAMKKSYFGQAGSNYAQFSPDGTLRFYEDGTDWRDENFNGFATRPTASAPDDIAWRGGSILAKGFNGAATMEQLMAGAELQHDYYQGSDLIVHVHWAPVNANAGNVQWNADYTVERDEVGLIINGTLNVVDAASGTAWQSTRVDIGTIPGDDLLYGDQVGIRLYRDPTLPADTYGSDAALSFTFGYHYQVDGLGSREIGVK